MPADVSIRPYQATDESGLLQVWNEAMWADPINELTWRSRYLLDPNFNAAECPVAVEISTGKLIGFMLGFSAKSPGDRRVRGPDAWVVGFGVSEGRRRKGIGHALIDHLESRWSAAGIVRIEFGPYLPGYVSPGIDEVVYDDAIRFLTGIGAGTLSRPLSMSASLTGYQPFPRIADVTRELAESGISVRHCESRNILPLLTFIDRHFPHWRGDATSVLADCFGGDPRFVTMHVAMEGDEIVGYAQSRHERFGPFGVNTSFRGRGVGAILLSRTLCAMRASGFHCAWFLWTSDRAAKLYRDHGFEEARRFALMAKSIGSSRNP